VNPLPIYQPCFGKKAMVSTPYGVMYVCPDGIQQIQNAVTYAVMTEEILPKNYFCETGSYIMGYSDNKLFIGNDDGTNGGFFLLDDLGAGLFTFGFEDHEGATGWYTDVGTLYFLASDGTDNFICTFNTGDNMQMIWQSKDLANRLSGDYQNGKVVADGQVAFGYYIDGEKQSFADGDKQVNDSHTFRLPSGKRGRVFSFALCTSSVVDYVGLGDSTHEFA